jgi:hypothetical protein
MPKCRYAKHCDLYNKRSFTCGDGGGSYCGRYREYEEEYSESPSALMAVFLVAVICFIAAVYWYLNL